MSLTFLPSHRVRLQASRYLFLLQTYSPIANTSSRSNAAYVLISRGQRLAMSQLTNSSPCNPFVSEKLSHKGRSSLALSLFRRCYMRWLGETSLCSMTYVRVRFTSWSMLAIRSSIQGMVLVLRPSVRLRTMISGCVRLGRPMACIISSTASSSSKLLSSLMAP